MVCSTLDSCCLVHYAYDLHMRMRWTSTGCNCAACCSSRIDLMRMVCGTLNSCCLVQSACDPMKLKLQDDALHYCKIVLLLLLWHCCCCS
jgi:hypothetical protein